MQNCMVLFCGPTAAECPFPNSPKLFFAQLNELVLPGVFMYIRQLCIDLGRFLSNVLIAQRSDCVTSERISFV